MNKLSVTAIIFLITLFSFQEDRVYRIASDTCECLHNKGSKDNTSTILNQCINSNKAYGKEIISELMLYCDAYQYFFEKQRRSNYIDITVEEARKKIDIKNIDIDKVSSVSSLRNYCKLYFAAYKYDEALKVIDKLLSINSKDPWAYFYRGWIFENWDDYEFAFISYQNFAKYHSDKNFAYQLMYLAQKKEIDAEDYDGE